MAEFERDYSGAPWERRVGYCRSVKAGSRIFVTGTAPVARGGGVHAAGDAYEQTRRCLEIIGETLAAQGAKMADVVRTRIFVTDITRWEEYGRAHRETFGENPPATTMVQVSALIDPEMLVEIEADAVLRDGAPEE